jgi:hypothetical protein
MELQERFVCCILGAVWEAVLGLLLALFFHYVVGASFDSGFLIFNWKNTILSCAAAFAAIGLVFKASAGSIIGTLMGWVWSAIEHDSETNKPSFRLFLAVLATLAALSHYYFAAKKG